MKRRPMLRVVRAVVVLALTATLFALDGGAAPTSTRPCRQPEKEACLDTFVVRADGRGRHLLERNPVVRPGQPVYDISRDLKWILVSQGYPLYSARVDRPTAHEISRVPVGSAAFSPDGRRVAFMRGGAGSVWVANRDGTRPRALSKAPAGYPSWAPDSRRVVFLTQLSLAVRSDSLDTGIVTIAGDGKRRAIARWRGSGSPDLAWAPRGGWIAYVGRAAPMSPFRIRLVRADGRRGITIRNASRPTWSPDGRRLAFIRPAGGVFALRVINRDGGGQREIGRTDCCVSPEWAPSGRVIAYVSPRIGGLGPRLTLVSPAGGRRVVLRRERDYVQIDRIFWSSDSSRIAYVRAVLPHGDD